MPTDAPVTTSEASQTVTTEEIPNPRPRVDAAAAALAPLLGDRIPAIIQELEALAGPIADLAEAEYPGAHAIAGARDSYADVVPHRASGYSLADNSAGAFRNAENSGLPLAEGGLRSTTSDMLRWNDALFGGRVVSAAFCRLWTRAAACVWWRPRKRWSSELLALRTFALTAGQNPGGIRSDRKLVWDDGSSGCGGPVFEELRSRSPPPTLL